MGRVILASIMVVCVFALGCLNTSSSGGTGSVVAPPPTLQGQACSSPVSTGFVGSVGTNVMTVQVGGNAVCGFNQPCTSVKICQPGSLTNCQTITDILVDTGSFGLRIFRSAITAYDTSLLPTIPVQIGSVLAECAEFGSTNTWGPVVQADAYLGGEPVLSSLSIQLMDSTFALIPANSPCGTQAASGPTDSSSPFNGILGVGLSPIDDFGGYFQCSTQTEICSPILTPTAAQEIPNPVSKLGTDNNGVLLQLPQLAGDQQFAVLGALVLGVGTEGNNSAVGVTAYPADPNQFTFTTSDTSGTTTNSFLDSGTNFLIFEGEGLPTCSGSDVYCLSQTTCFNAQITGVDGSPTVNFPFRLLSDSSLNTALNANSAIGLFAGFSIFDWGLPFFYGRNVFVVMSGKSAVLLGTGPLWAF